VVLLGAKVVREMIATIADRGSRSPDRRNSRLTECNNDSEARRQCETAEATMISSRLIRCNDAAYRNCRDFASHRITASRCNNYNNCTMMPRRTGTRNSFFADK